MNALLLQPKVQAYIQAHLAHDPLSLVFKKSAFAGISQAEIVEQLASKQRIEKKLPTWFAHDQVYYPNKLHLSQSSSEITAQYKASLVQGDCLADLTGGFGVDALAFSKVVKRVVHLERDQNLAAVAKHNFRVLGAKNVESFTGDGMEWLKTQEGKLDWLYVDPSRRDSRKKKVFLLTDCTPNVVAAQEMLLGKAEKVLIKTGPLLDLSAGLDQLRHVREIHIVAVRNEVKEVLWWLQRGAAETPLVKTINVTTAGAQRFNFFLKDEALAAPKLGPVGHYLYEPNAAILKSGAFNILSKALDLVKLHPHSHLYTSKHLLDFPGRVFKVNQVLPYSKKTIKALGLKKANITVRNFPLSVAALREKTGLKEGGEDYLFFTTNMHNKLLIVIGLKSG
ncbi:THUMP-like domain-containing protein [Maribacter sp. 2307ULW6-5]|uniref:THUMP-like domain-containing protein n=1 Tax=Maribacter sp. 2307ULW6-5 TaxID=3386275 RepID=UPI0039BD0995